MSRSAIDLNPLPAEGAWASMRERFRSTQLGLSVKFQPNGASHRESGEPITTENLGYGQSVKVVADAVTQNMRSDKALAVIGPRAFGIEDTSPSWLVTKPAFSAPARWSATGSSALLQALKVYSIPLRVCAWLWHRMPLRANFHFILKTLVFCHIDLVVLKTFSIEQVHGASAKGAPGFGINYYLCHVFFLYLLLVKSMIMIFAIRTVPGNLYLIY